MASATAKRLENSIGYNPSGDVIGGVVLAVLGILHLFVLQLTGIEGFVLLLAVWPLASGVVGTLVERARDSGQDTRVTAALTGVFGAVITVALIFLAGLAGLWSVFIHTTFGTGLLPGTLSALILLTIAWTVFAYIGGYLYRQATAA